jgi:hypothetical protein
MVYLAQYYVRWVATSHDNSKDKLRHVIIGAETWDSARKEITEYEESENEYCRVEFESLSLIKETVLWK